MNFQKIVFTFIFIFITSSKLYATEGYDYYKTSNYVQFDSYCLSSGDELDMYDYSTSDYHNVEIQNVQCESSGCEIEIYDYTLSDYRYIELEESIC